MDYGDFRGFFTILILVMFIGIVVWAYSRKRKADFDEAANLVFDDEQPKHKEEHSGEKSR